MWEKFPAVSHSAVTRDLSLADFRDFRGYFYFDKSGRAPSYAPERDARPPPGSNSGSATRRLEKENTTLKFFSSKWLIW